MSDPRVQELISEIHGDLLVADYVVIAEVVDEDGDVLLVRVTSGDMPLWRALGMLEFQVASVKGAVEPIGYEDVWDEDDA